MSDLLLCFGCKRESRSQDGCSAEECAEADNWVCRGGVWSCEECHGLSLCINCQEWCKPDSMETDVGGEVWCFECADVCLEAAEEGE